MNIQVQGNMTAEQCVLVAILKQCCTSGGHGGCSFHFGAWNFDGTAFAVWEKHSGTVLCLEEGQVLHQWNCSPWGPIAGLCVPVTVRGR